MTRREHCGLLLAVPAGARCAAAPSPGWSAEWDRALILAAVEGLEERFDPAEALLSRKVGSEYRYHTSVRSDIVHPTRDSLEYGLLLLEAGGEERQQRALRIIERIVDLQDTDPASKWYGIWGYYLEEPPPKMAPADWNWADFNGSLLLLIEYRHGARLAEPLRARVRESIRHAAYSVRRRNVTMTYTNIAVQGTFVTLAAAQLLGDDDLRQYAVDRLQRFCQTVDATGSFAEYNSPTYTHVTILNLTRMRMLLKDEAVLARAGRIHYRAWLHLARHWHAPTRQLAGPMSRCYSTDIGQPLWLQKALGGKLAFSSLEDIRTRKVTASGEVGILDYQCPADLVPHFLELPAAPQHREIFLPAQSPIRPAQGTTWLERDFCLGSVNRGDFWVQRRPLLAYWGGPSRPARYVQARVIKDDYDFASALFYSVQERNCVLGLVNFRSPGGDKHPSLDPVRDGAFRASRLRLRLDIAGVAPEAEVLANADRIAVNLGGAKLWFAVRGGRFGPHTPKLGHAREDGMLTLSLDLFRSGQPSDVQWAEVKTAWAAFTLAIGGKGGSLRNFDRRMAATPFRLEAGDRTVRLSWQTPAGELSLTGSTVVNAIAAQDEAFEERLNGKPVPLVRLSEERLA